MTHHTNDTFGNEASRPQDAIPAIPIEETQHTPADPQSEPPGDLKDLAELAATSQERPQASSPGETPPARAEAQRTPRRKSVRAKKARAKQPSPLDANEALHDLEERGFSEDEARRLIDISGRITQSAEAREAEATMRRLRFTRWLVEHGMLDEWSA
jgi:hypothetical protein